jgi:hypothetical protein
MVKYVFSPYILRNCQEWFIYFKNGKKKLHKLLFIKNDPFRLFFATSANKIIISGPHYLNFSPTFCEADKNGSYTLKNYEIFWTFFLLIL